MCLCANRATTDRLADKIAAFPSKSILVYKLYSAGRTQLSSVVYPRSKGGRVKGPGWIQSNRKSAQCAELKFKFHRRSVYEGCHVYLRPPRSRCYSNKVIVPVRGHLKDFVAAGHGQAVFTRLYLTKKNFQRAMRG